jgi:hypothetical protein
LLAGSEQVGFARRFERLEQCDERSILVRVATERSRSKTDGVGPRLIDPLQLRPLTNA